MRHWPKWLRLLLVIAAVIAIPTILNLATKRWYGPGDLVMNSLPDVFLWAWERPEDLRFLQPDDAGIAVLLAHIFIEGEEPPRMERRKQHLLLTPKTPLMAVVRIEGTSFRGTSIQADQLTDHLMRAFDDAHLVAVQIDFDAGASDRAFYSMILSRLRNRLPKRVPITITALASWCEGDRWIKALPVDEAVPMMFRMGPDSEQIRRMLATGEGFTEPLCRTSLGLSTDESLKLPPRFNGRVYLFHPKPWTKEAYEAALKELK